MVVTPPFGGGNEGSSPSPAAVKSIKYMKSIISPI